MSKAGQNNGDKEKFRKMFGKDISEFESVKKAVVGLSRVTTQKYYDELPKFFLYLKMNPDKVIEDRWRDVSNEDIRSRGEKYKAILDGMFDELKKSGEYRLSTLATSRSRILGFFSRNHETLAISGKSLKVKLPMATKKKTENDIPKHEYVRLIYKLADSARDKAIVAFSYQNGLNGVDVASLTIEDVLESGEAKVKAWHVYVKERSKLKSKNAGCWVGVLSPECAVNLNDMLVIEGRDLSDRKQKLFRGNQGDFNSHAVRQVLSILMRKAELTYKPKSLRDAFKDRLIDAKVDSELRETMLGHTTDVQHKYNYITKGIKEAFQQAYDYLKLDHVVLTTEAKENYEKLAKGYEKFMNGLGLDVNKIKDNILSLTEQLADLTVKTNILMHNMTEEQLDKAQDEIKKQRDLREMQYKKQQEQKQQTET